MTRARIALAATAAVAAAAVALFGGLLADGPAPARAGASAGDQALLRELLGELSRGDTGVYVRRLERRAAARPDADTLTLLGLAYQQRARETADPAFYSLSETALRRALGAGADESLVTGGLASLAVSRHRFGDALVLARRALRANPENAAATGALGDALANRGRYREAFRAFDRMAVLSPSVASYARVAHARELLGRPDAAAEAVRLALELDFQLPEHAAAAFVQLGNVHLGIGRLDAAEQAFAEALARVPAYARAEAGLARVEAARSEYVRAVRRLRRVVAVLPLPEHAIWLGDTLAAAGRRSEAREAYALVDAMQRVFAAGGVRTELQTALFDLDHGRRPADALRRARLAYRAAPNVNSADVLAWALERNGRCTEARVYSKRALQLGTLDALKFFHRGMIERCLGRHVDARRWFLRALETNPHFSLLWSPVARRFA